jgi:putative ABC transport system permease protein
MYSLNSLIQDIRFSLRLMRQRARTTAVVLIAIVFGMGLNTAIFSVVNAVLLRPLPIFEPDRLVWLRSVNRTNGPLATSYPDFLDWRAQSHSFASMAAMYFSSSTLTGNGPAQQVKAAGISAAGLKVWGLNPVLGRDFTDADDQPGASRVVMLTHRFWQREFGGDPAILGKSLTLDGQQYTIISVLQPTPLLILNNSDVYVANGPLINPHIMERDTLWFFVYGRLKRNVSLTQAQAEMQTITRRLEAQYPDTNKNIGIRIVSVAENLTADGRKPLPLLVLASSLIFLLAAVNVMTVSLGNTAERAQELSVRLALGATRATLLRQLLVQALILATVGASLGLLLAKAGLAFFVLRFPNIVLRFQETSIDSTVLAVTVVMALTTTLLAALLPALYAFRLNLNSELRGEWSSPGPAKYRLLGRGALIVFEVTLASGLSLVAGLLIKSFYEVEKVDLGFNPHHVFTFRITPPLSSYKEPEKQAALYEATIEKLASLPGVSAASGTSGLPLTSQGWLNNLEVDAQSPLFGQQVLVEDEAILPGYFQAMGLPLLEGRAFTEADRDGAPLVVIVDNLLAARLWPGQNPLGKRVRLALIRGEPWRWLEVVGVVREVKHFGGPEAKVRWMQVYVPQYQDTTPALSFVVNTTIPEGAARDAAEKAVHDLDRDIPVEDFQTMDAYFDTFLNGRKAGLWLLTTFAGIAIVLGMIGVYGVVGNAVTQRRREMAIRMALGATPSATMVLVTRLGLLSTLVGIGIGSVIVISLSRLLASLLFGVTALDPAIYILSAVFLVALAVIASAMPAMKLLRFNIQEILRQ